MAQEREHTPPIQPGSVERSTDALHHALQEHISGCDQCREVIDRTGPRGFGQRSKMCKQYFKIAQMFADGVEL